MGAPSRLAPPHDDSATGSTSPDFLTRAEALRRAGRRTEALALCRTGLARFPAFHSARALYGRLLFEAGDVSGARAHLEGVVARAPGHLAARRWLAAALDRVGEPEEAARVAASAERLAPHDARLRAALDRLFGPVEPRAAPPTPRSELSQARLLPPSADVDLHGSVSAPTAHVESRAPSTAAPTHLEGQAPSRPNTTALAAPSRTPSRASRIDALEQWLAAVRRACPDTSSDTQ
jgi:tetratricopeptide (TPR) repeat protein